MRLSRLLLVVLFVSCRDSLAPAGGGRPVISLVIIGGDSVHTATITLSNRPDSAIPDTARPADPAQISLSISDTAGNSFPLIASATPGRYTVAFPALAGRAYQLTGTAYGSPVSATTRLPQSFSIVAPMADTIRLTDGTSTVATLRVPYRFQAPGADGFAAFLMTTGGILESTTRYHEQQGELVLVRSGGVRPLVLLAFDPGAAACHLTLRPVENINGSLGCFGSALRQNRFLDAQ